MVGYREAEADTVNPMRPIAVEGASHPITCDVRSPGHLPTPLNDGGALVSMRDGPMSTKIRPSGNGAMASSPPCEERFRTISYNSRNQEYQ